jgi:phosphohistidine phosphatase
MPRLLIVRHAKAVAHDREDFERPLADRGRADAERMGVWIAKRGLTPEAIIHSGAARTKETAAILAAQWPAGIEIAEDRGLYDASAQAVFDLIRGLSDARASVAIVGHNPAIAKIAILLAGSGSREKRSQMAAKFPPGAVAVIEFADRRWREVAPDAGALLHFRTPGALIFASD